MQNILSFLNGQRKNYKIRRELDEHNMQVGFYVAILYMALDIFFLVTQFIYHGYIGIPVEKWELVAGTSLLAAFGLGILCTGLYTKGIYKRHRVVFITVVIMGLTACVFSLFASSDAYSKEAVLLMFVVLELLVNCVFMLEPLYSAIIIIITCGIYMTEYYNRFGKASLDAVMQFVMVTIVIFAISTLRYYEHVKDILNRTEMEKINKYLSEVSLMDDLTGLHNIRALRKYEDDLVGHKVHAIMIEIDGFRYFVDSYGHAAGHEVLQQFAQCLIELFGDDHVFRYEEALFYIVDKDVRTTDYRRKIEEARALLRTIETDGKRMNMTLSAGYVQDTCDDVKAVKRLIRLADSNLYQAKKFGDVVQVDNAHETKQVLEESILEIGRLYHENEVNKLTGLPNAQYFRDLTAKIIAIPEKRSQGIVILYFDIANFKSFNENYGFRAGDGLLRAVAGIIQKEFPNRIVSHLGEDHYAATVYSDKVEEHIANIHSKVHELQRDIVLEIKTGVAEVTKDDYDVAAIVDRARIACETIKNDYNKDFRFYTEDLGEKQRRVQYIINHVDEAVSKGWIKVYYQPVVRTATRKICGMEALARWIDPTIGFVSPAEFIPVLEQYHLIHRLDACIVEQVCRDYESFVKVGQAPAPVSLNLSRLDFTLCDIIDIIENSVQKHNVNKKHIHIEITESALLEEKDFLKEKVDELHNLGYEVWLDDFGSGYSALNTLDEFDFDTMKLDIEFMRRYSANHKNKPIMTAIVSMAKDIKMDTVVEGVETEEQFGFLSSIGVDKIQGFLFGKPEPLERYLEGLIPNELHLEIEDL